MKYKILVLPPESRLQDVCSAPCRELLDKNCHPVWNDLGRDYRAEELMDLVRDVDIILTSWGSPDITEELLDRALNLRVIAHAAGSVKRLVPDSVFERGITVFSAAPRIAWSVGEYCLTALLMQLNRIDSLDADVRTGRWRKRSARRHELRGKRVGIVSASSTARAFIQLLRPFDCAVSVYDPYLTEAQAHSLGVQRVALDEVMQNEVISLHVPVIPETNQLISADMLHKIPDDAILINSSRAAVLDESTLVKELQTGRFRAVLDVFGREPLPDDHPFTKLDNVLLTPHVAGDTIEGHQALMLEVLSDALHFLGGGQPAYAVDPSKWSIMA